MVARSGQQFLSFASGELAPQFHGRRDVKNFYSGFAEASNMEANPLGGGRQSPRSRFRGRGGRTVTIGADASSGAVGPITAGTVVATADLGANGALCGADITFTGTGAVADGLRVELQDAGGSWAAIASPVDVQTTARAYRICIPPGAPVTGRRARLVANATISLTAATIHILTETLGTAGRFLTHTFSTSEAYVFTAAAGHADIWRDGVFAGAVKLPHDASQMTNLQKTQRGASMLLWHQGIAPHEIRRDGADHQWTQATRSWTAIPDVDYGGVYSDTTEHWTIYFNWDDTTTALTFHAIVVTINGEDTASVQIPGGGGGISTVNWATFCPALAAAIEALAVVEAGVTVTNLTDFSDSASLQIQFTGAGNTGEQFIVTAKLITATNNAAANSGRTQRGRKGGEAIMSAERGWPRTGIYAEDRLIMGGFAARGDGYLGSRSGEYFDLNSEIESAASGFVFSLNADGAEDILRFHKGPHFMIFTNERHYYIANPPFNRLQPPNQRTSETPGIHPNCAPEEIEGRIIYVSHDGSQLLSAQYSDVTQKYDTQPISLLANHIVRDVVAGALQRSSSDTVANRLFLARGSGAMTLAGIIRNQDVTGFFPWTTDGEVVDVCVDGSGTAHVLVKRPIGEGEGLTVEELTLDSHLDCAVTISQASATAVEGLDIHEGCAVWAKADGTFFGPFTVEDGAITLPYAAEEVDVGRWIAPVLTLLPMVREISERNVVVRPGRIHTIKINARAIGSLAIAANGQPVFDVPLAADGDAVDGPWPDVEGLISVTGLTGFKTGTSVTLTQLRPGAFDMRDITLEGRF
jgi:hypothetical protein